MVPYCRSIFLAIIVLLVCWSDVSPAEDFPLVVEAPPLSPDQQQTKFHLPPGFAIELVAAEPDIAKPMNLNFDRRGRLFVTQSVEYPFPAKGEGRDQVQMLEDSDGDGNYDRATTAVESLNIPIGITPVADELILYTIPFIHRYRRGETGAAWQHMQQLYGPFAYDDTHGMNNAFTRWLDGWIYACHGFRNVSTVSGSDGQQITLASGNTYRFAPDGSHIELVTHGQVNPFGLCFDPLGNIYTADCHSQPIYQLIRGAYYPSFGKPHDGLGFAPTVIQHSHGSTGIGGIVYYAADHFPPEYRDTIFVGNPITHRINHDRLEPHGASYKGIEQPDFLSCDDPWFRPVDLQLGPDGALYVADFYNRIIGHYEVPLDHPGRDRHRGRIWRIVYRGENEAAEPLQAVQDLSVLELPQLWQKLDDANLTVRVLATHELVDRFGSAASGDVRQRLESSQGTARQRAHALWFLHRLDALTDEVIQQLSADSDRLVRVHLMKALAEVRDWQPRSLDLWQLVRASLQDEDPYVRRAAAEALARHPRPTSIMHLVQCWLDAPAQDTHLIHTLRIAVRDHLAADEAYASLPPELLEQPAALVCLMDASRGVHNADAARFILSGLKSPGVANHIPWLEMVRFVARHLPESELNELYVFLESETIEPWQTEVALYQNIGQALQERGLTLDSSIRQRAVALARDLIAANDPAQQAAGLAMAKELRLHELYDQLIAVATDNSKDEPVRVAALEACATARPEASEELLSQLLKDASQPSSLRGQVARVLARRSTPTSQQAMIDAARHAHRQLAAEIAAALATSQDGAAALLEAIEQGKLSPRVLQETGVQQAVMASQLPEAAERLERLSRDLPPLDQQLAELIGARRSGYRQAAVDIEQGRSLFRKHCAACHQLENEGYKIGPELDGIGHRGLDRLLEDVLTPSRNVDPNFQTTIIQTIDGQVLAGLALREEGEVLIMIDNKGQQHRIPLDEIELRKLSPLSPMPADVATLMSEADFYHLIGYLLSHRHTDEQPTDKQHTDPLSK